MQYDLPGLGTDAQHEHKHSHVSARTTAALIRRHQDCAPYWGSPDEPTLPHPIRVPSGHLQLAIRLCAVGLILLVGGVILAGCTYYEHRDGGGYSVRYAQTTPTSEDPPPPPRRRPPPRPKYAYAPPPPGPEVVVVERVSVPEGESHPVLNVGKDNEIPREYRHYVSDRSLRTLRSRRAMCKEARPGYCNRPNVPHCHGPFCHSHAGGDKRHTH